MAHSYSFAIVRLSSVDARDERLNIGLVVFDEGRLDVRVTKRLEKVRAISAAADAEQIRGLLESLVTLDEKLRDRGVEAVAERVRALSTLTPISLSDVGTFLAESTGAYEDRISSIMRAMVEAEPAPVRTREKRSRLLTQIKKNFRQQRVLAKRDEDLSSHRIVAGYEVDKGLVADLVLRNGAMHVVETVDASSETESFRKAIGDIGVAALVLERARMKFGSNQTKAKLVYSASATLEDFARPSLNAAEHQGAELVNWESAEQRNKFLRQLASMATPIQEKRLRSVVDTLRVR